MIFFLSHINNVILAIFLIIIFLHLIFTLINRRKNDSSYNAEMTLSFGILGTFLGIVLGLLKFDVNDIQGSIPQLLSGLKFAFMTSIAGMISSILIKLFPGKDKDSHSDATPETIQAELTKINQTLERNNNDLRDDFQKLISGDNDTSLVSQIKLLKNDLVEQLKENKDLNEKGFVVLKEEFTKLGDKIAKLSSDAMVEALKKAIVEFNKQLADQLGDNFRQLNEGVKNLLEWQEQYKDTVDKMQDSIRIIIEQLNDSTSAIKEISSSLDPIPEIVQSIETLFNDAEKSIGLLTTTLESYKDMSEKATDAFPIIENNLTKMTKGFSDNVNKIGAEMEATSRTFTDSIVENTKQINKTVNDSNVNITSAIEKAAKDSGDVITQSMDGLNQGMGTALEGAIEKLGTELASLSRKFVDDYGPLTDSISKMISEIEKNNRGRS
jgi:chromosome segregation ATPase